jgi:homocysteine S-methyltransferase
MKLLRRKVEAGADFIMTQAVYDPEAIDRFLKQAAKVKVPILLGIMPLHSARHAEFLHKELVGIIVPDRVRERMRKAGDDGLAEGIAFSRELIEAALPSKAVAGIYLMPAFGRYEVGVELAAFAREQTSARR